MLYFFLIDLLFVWSQFSLEVVSTTNSRHLTFTTIEEKGEDLRRTITRGACDPFTCYRGLGASTENSEVPEEEMEAAMQQSDDDSKPSGVPLNALEPRDESPWYLGENCIV